MSYLTTELLTSLLRGGTAANEFLRSKIEEGVNAVLKAELAGFLGYEKHSSAGWHTGNSRNGSYQRTIVTSYGKITVDVPRDRNGEFQSPLLPTRKQRVDSLETTIIQLYQRGVTTRQIAELIEQMYGHCYTPATISTIAANVSDQVEQFHKRPVAKRYAVIFCDAMYVNLRRDSEAKESIHVLLGITPEGHKEILDYAILPSESALNYADMLKSLKTRGLEQVLLFVSDGLVGLFSMNSRNTWTEKQAFSLDSHYSLVPSTGHRLLAGTPTTIVYAISAFVASVLRILGVRDGLAPLVARLRARDLEREMREPTMLLGTVPVLDARGNLDNVAGREALRRLALFLIPARAVNTDEHLPAALLRVMDVPEIAAARLERNVADDERLVRLRQNVQIRLPREILGIGIIRLAESEETATALRIRCLRVDFLRHRECAQAFGQPA